MTRARDEGGATTAVRRVLVVAAAVAGLWLLSWLISGRTQAATRHEDPVGEVVAGVLGGRSSGGTTVSRDPVRGGGVEPVSRTVRAAAPVVQPVVGAVAPMVAPASRAVRTVAGPVVRSVAPVVEPVVRIAAPVLDPVLDAARTVVDPVIQPIVAPGDELAVPPAAEPADEPPVTLVTPVRRAMTSTPAARHVAARPAARDRTYDRPSATAGTVAAKPHLEHHTTSSQPARTPRNDSGNAPAPRSPAPAEAACGTTRTIPPAFLTADHGPHVVRVSAPTHGDFVPLWRACEPGIGPG